MTYGILCIPLSIWVITKVLVSRLRPFLVDLISPLQSCFIPDRASTKQVKVVMDTLEEFCSASGLMINTLKSNREWVAKQELKQGSLIEGSERTHNGLTPELIRSNTSSTVKINTTPSKVKGATRRPKKQRKEKNEESDEQQVRRNMIDAEEIVQEQPIIAGNTVEHIHDHAEEHAQPVIFSNVSPIRRYDTRGPTISTKSPKKGHNIRISTKEAVKNDHVRVIKGYLLDM
ncbi:hypothetical protein MTR_6g044280 [Medicago truncatula]|uniref:Transmembrane protein n=1 Tax=Medicago truncatula TaxID=3880 RepID=G7KJ01_MEDTR|nr:hypothetical protein MTR_6g044280 [Medicago truncatula]